MSSKDNYKFLTSSVNIAVYEALAEKPGASLLAIVRLEKEFFWLKIYRACDDAEKC
jgi:hypothetical protein